MAEGCHRQHLPPPLAGLGQPTREGVRLRSEVAGTMGTGQGGRVEEDTARPLAEIEGHSLRTMIGTSSMVGTTLANGCFVSGIRRYRQPHGRSPGGRESVRDEFWDGRCYIRGSARHAGRAARCRPITSKEVGKWLLVQ